MDLHSFLLITLTDPVQCVWSKRAGLPVFVLRKTLIGMGSERECLFYSLPCRCRLWLY